MKRSRLRKEGKQKISLVQRKLWEECRRVATVLYKPDCYTCPSKNLSGSNKQLGHGPWPKSVLGAYLKYDMRVLRWQCSGCNQFKGGMGAEFYKRMLAEHGPEYMEQLERDRQVTVKALDHYLELLQKYKEM